MTDRPRLFIFDADGTLRWTKVPGQHCPYAEDQWELFPNVAKTLAGIDWDVAALGIASNQDAVALGHLSRKSAESLLRQTVHRAIGRVPPRMAIELCTCPLDVRCDCRKPQPGMLLSILRRFDVAPQDAIYVGDLDLDREAARRAGIPFVDARAFFVNAPDGCR